MDFLLYAIIPVAFLCWFFRARHAGALFTLLGIQLAIAIPFEFAAIILDHRNEGNLWLYDIYLPLEMLLLLGIALHSWSSRVKWIAGTFIMAGYVLMYLKDYASGALAEALLASCSILYSSLVFGALFTYRLYQLAQSDDRQLWRIPEFWLFFGLLLYFGGLVPYIGLYNYMAEHEPSMIKKLDFVIPSLCFVRYALTAVACLLVKPRPERSAA